MEKYDQYSAAHSPQQQKNSLLERSHDKYKNATGNWNLLQNVQCFCSSVQWQWRADAHLVHTKYASSCDILSLGRPLPRPLAPRPRPLPVPRPGAPPRRGMPTGRECLAYFSSTSGRRTVSQNIHPTCSNASPGSGDLFCHSTQQPTIHYSATQSIYKGWSISNENQCIRFNSFTIYISVKSTFSTNKYTGFLWMWCHCNLWCRSELNMTIWLKNIHKNINYIWQKLAQ